MMTELANTPTSFFERLRIHPADPKDLDAVHKILSQATDWLASRGMTHWNGVHTKERILADFEKSKVLLGMLADRAVATVTISFDTPWYHQPSDRNFWQDPNASAAYIRKLAVLPEYMKQGLATKLLMAAEETALKLGSRFARLDTNPAFPELVPYYIERGYLKRGERDGNSFFEKPLSSSL